MVVVAGVDVDRRGRGRGGDDGGRRAVLVGAARRWLLLDVDPDAVPVVNVQTGERPSPSVSVGSGPVKVPPDPDLVKVTRTLEVATGLPYRSPAER